MTIYAPSAVLVPPTPPQQRVMVTGRDEFRRGGVPRQEGSMDAGQEILATIRAWEAERDEIVGQDFTPERSRRVEELDGLIDRAWESLAPGVGDVR